jgi:hypothetical protein
LFWFFLLSAVVATASWVVASYRPAHCPVAWLLTLGFFADLIQWTLDFYWLLPVREFIGTAPYTGLYRVLFHIEQATFLSWHIGIVALAMVVLLDRRPWPAFGAWAIAIAILSITYPTTRGDVLRRCYLAIEVAILAILTGCYVMWWWRRKRPTFQNWCMLVIGSVEFTTLIGPYSRNFFDSWNVAQAMYATLYVVLLVVHGGVIWDSSSQSN